MYWGGYRGLIRDAYAPLDEFWVTDAETGDIVRDESGEIVQFKSADLQLVAAPPRPAQVDAKDKSGVLLIGREEHMVKILEHFGPPHVEERRSPQQLLAIPCNMCEPGQLSTSASDGVAEEVLALARRLRRDIHVGVRASQLKHAVEPIVPELAILEGYYVLSAVQLPYSLESIEAEGLNMWEAHRRKEVCNQVDLCATAICEHAPGEAPQVAARQALGETCGIEISDALWATEVQLALRRRLGLDFPTELKDASGVHVVVTLLPDDAVATKIQEVLCFSEPAGVDYLSPDSAAPAGKAAQSAGGSGAADDVPRIQGKTVREWEEEQRTEFANEPKLPPDWLRVKSRTSGDVYYFNKKTQKATFDFPESPLPPGWTKQVSKSTGKAYYFHAKRGTSTFERPKA